MMLMSCMKHIAAKLPELQRLHFAATLGKTMPRQMSSIQGKQADLAQQSCHSASFLAQAQQHNSCFVCRKI